MRLLFAVSVFDYAGGLAGGLEKSAERKPALKSFLSAFANRDFAPSYASALRLTRHVRNVSLQPLAPIILGSLRIVEFVPPYESFLYFACREFVGLLFFEILLKCSQNN